MPRKRKVEVDKVEGEQSEVETGRRKVKVMNYVWRVFLLRCVER